MEDFKNLTKLNICKANYIVNNVFGSISYVNYLQELDQKNIFTAEKYKILNEKIISVLHSGFFFVVDYWGNKNGFYNKNLV